MKKKFYLCALLLLLLVPGIVFAQNRNVFNDFYVKSYTHVSTPTLTSLGAYDGLIFFKDYVNSQATLNADYSVGDATATFTAARSASAPSTYVNSSGVVVTTTTADVPRYQGGYYDATGFHAQSGLMIEPTRSNACPSSAAFSNAYWDASNMSVSDNSAASPDAGNNATTLTSTNSNATLMLHTASTRQTFSIWMKRVSGSGNIDLTANSGSTWTTKTLTSSWSRFSVTATSASQTCGIRVVTNGDSILIWGAQFESRAFMSSYVPTTAGALTAAADLLSYKIKGNRNVLQETVHINFASPMIGNVAWVAGDWYFMSADTKSREINWDGDSATFQASPNSADGGSCWASGGYWPAANTTYTVTLMVEPTASSYYARTFVSGTQYGLDNSHTWVPNAWGENDKFYIGSNVGSNVGYLLVRSVSIWNNYQANATVTAIHNIQNQ